MAKERKKGLQQLVIMGLERTRRSLLEKATCRISKTTDLFKSPIHAMMISRFGLSETLAETFQIDIRH